MNIHQIIYTSCKRGINGTNDGQQVFSYDALFEDANNDEVKSLFSYQPPILDPGVIMSEEIVPTLPKSFVYRKMNNDKGALALSTYLGRDYMGSAGRFGNHLSHVVVADISDMQNYPCEYYGSGLLRDHMEFDEVNNPERPDFLPQPILERGFTVDIDTVIDFLSVDNRIEHFKNMLYAVLAFEVEKKRVIICDEPDNIIMWIAAIEYTLPLKTALNINFSTYVFDPSLSASQICGVIPKGTRYTVDSKDLNFVFDFYQNDCAKFEISNHYFDFIDTAMSFSYDSILDFHQFIKDGYTYDKADEKMYAAYWLYSILSDGIADVNEKELKVALDFAYEYSLPEEHGRIIQKLFGQYDCLMETSLQAFLCIMKYATSKRELLLDDIINTSIKLIIDKVLYELSNSNCGENIFTGFYSRADSICRDYGFTIATELMKSSNREKLFAVLQNDFSRWKIEFIVKIVTTFVLEQRTPIDDLLIETPLGQTYYGLVQTVYSNDTKNGFFLVTCILNEFSSDCKYLVNMVLNIEGMLLDLPDGNKEIEALWKYFAQNMVKYLNADFTTVCSILGSYQRYEQIYMLYSLAMSNANELEEIHHIFIDHYKSYVTRDRNYSQQYCEQILNKYYNRLKNFEKQFVHSAKVELFNIVSSTKMDTSIAEDLVNDIVLGISLKSPSRENRKLIQGTFDYLYYDLNRPIKGKLLLFVIAMTLEKCKNTSQLHDAFDNLEHLTVDEKGNLGRVAERALENYFNWLLPEIYVLCERAGDFERLFSLFKMPGDVASLFFTSCTMLYLRQSKEDKNYRLLSEFLGFVFVKSNSQIREEIGKVLCKLSKQKLLDLDETVNSIYSNDKAALSQWNEIMDIAESTSPIVNNISNIFKRNND